MTSRFVSGCVTLTVIVILFAATPVRADDVQLYARVIVDTTALRSGPGLSFRRVYVARRQGLSGEEIARVFDAVMFALPFTLAVGRLGCALQHDHLGVASTSWFAVNFPAGPPWNGPRFDLGLLETLLCVVIALVFVALDRARAQQLRAPGLFFALFFGLYGPGRFALDFLRVGEARYLALTPAQWLMAGATLAAMGWLARSGRQAAARR